jgi:hypothetical protein
MNRQHARQPIEGSLVRDKGPVGRLPPIALEKTGHDTVTAAAVPHEHSARREDASEFGQHPSIVRGLSEKSE